MVLIGADWTRSKMLEHFRGLYVESKEVLVSDYVEKIMNNEMNKKDWIIYKGVKFRQTYFYKVISWLLTQKQEDIKCPEENCFKGYATIDGNEHISCNWCGHKFFPAPVESEGPEIAAKAQAFIDGSEEYQELKKKQNAIVEQENKVTYQTSSDSFDIIK